MNLFKDQSSRSNSPTPPAVKRDKVVGSLVKPGSRSAVDLFLVRNNSDNTSSSSGSGSNSSDLSLNPNKVPRNKAVRDVRERELFIRTRQMSEEDAKKGKEKTSSTSKSLISHQPASFGPSTGTPSPQPSSSAPPTPPRSQSPTPALSPRLAREEEGEKEVREAEGEEIRRARAKVHRILPAPVAPNLILSPTSSKRTPSPTTLTSSIVQSASSPSPPSPSSPNSLSPPHSPHGQPSSNLSSTTSALACPSFSLPLLSSASSPSIPRSNSQTQQPKLDMPRLGNAMSSKSITPQRTHMPAVPRLSPRGIFANRRAPLPSRDSFEALQLAFSMSDKEKERCGLGDGYRTMKSNWMTTQYPIISLFVHKQMEEDT